MPQVQHTKLTPQNIRSLLSRNDKLLKPRQESIRFLLQLFDLHRHQRPPLDNLILSLGPLSVLPLVELPVVVMRLPRSAVIAISKRKILQISALNVIVEISRNRPP